MADAWRPTSELERRLDESVRAGDQEGYFRVLAGAELVLPVPPDAVDDVLANTAQPTWPTQEEDGRVHVLTYTSAAAMRACLGPAYRHFMTLRFEDIAQSWPDAAWWLAVDVPGHGVADVALPIEARLPSWFVRQVAEGDGRPPRVGRPGTAAEGPWEELRGQHRDLPREEARRPEFQPANDVERELLRAAANNDHDLFLQTLAGTEVLLPVPEGTDYSLRPGRPGFPWQTRDVEGATVVPVFTSPERLIEAARAAGTGTEYIRLPFTVALRYWPHPDWQLAINSGSPAGGTVQAQQLPGLATWADQRAAQRMTDGFEPQNEIEQRLFDAARRRDTETFYTVLLSAQVLVPAEPDTPWGITPDDPAFPWQPVNVHGRTSIQVFTSLKWMNDALSSSRFVMPTLLDLVSAWPESAWTFVLNPGTPIDASMPGDQVRALAGPPRTVPEEPATPPSAATPPPPDAPAVPVAPPVPATDGGPPPVPAGNGMPLGHPADSLGTRVAPEPSGAGEAEHERPGPAPETAPSSFGRPQAGDLTAGARPTDVGPSAPVGEPDQAGTGGDEHAHGDPDNARPHGLPSHTTDLPGTPASPAQETYGPQKAPFEQAAELAAGARPTGLEQAGEPGARPYGHATDLPGTGRPSAPAVQGTPGPHEQATDPGQTATDGPATPEDPRLRGLTNHAPEATDRPQKAPFEQAAELAAGAQPTAPKHAGPVGAPEASRPYEAPSHATDQPPTPGAPTDPAQGTHEQGKQATPLGQDATSSDARHDPSGPGQTATDGLSEQGQPSPMPEDPRLRGLSSHPTGATNLPGSSQPSTPGALDDPAQPAEPAAAGAQPTAPEHAGPVGAPEASGPYGVPSHVTDQPSTPSVPTDPAQGTHGPHEQAATLGQDATSPDARHSPSGPDETATDGLSEQGQPSPMPEDPRLRGLSSHPTGATNLPGPAQSPTSAGAAEPATGARPTAPEHAGPVGAPETSGPYGVPSYAADQPSTPGAPIDPAQGTHEQGEQATPLGQDATSPDARHDPSGPGQTATDEPSEQGQPGPTAPPEDPRLRGLSSHPTGATGLPGTAHSPTPEGPGVPARPTNPEHAGTLSAPEASGPYGVPGHAADQPSTPGAPGEQATEVGQDTTSPKAQAPDVRHDPYGVPSDTTGATDLPGTSRPAPPGAPTDPAQAAEPTAAGAQPTRPDPAGTIGTPETSGPYGVPRHATEADLPSTAQSGAPSDPAQAAEPAAAGAQPIGPEHAETIGTPDASGPYGVPSHAADQPSKPDAGDVLHDPYGVPSDTTGATDLPGTGQPAPPGPPTDPAQAAEPTAAGAQPTGPEHAGTIGTPDASGPYGVPRHAAEADLPSTAQSEAPSDPAQAAEPAAGARPIGPERAETIGTPEASGPYGVPGHAADQPSTPDAGDVLHDPAGPGLTATDGPGEHGQPGHAAAPEESHLRGLSSHAVGDTGRPSTAGAPGEPGQATEPPQHAAATSAHGLRAVPEAEPAFEPGNRIDQELYEATLAGDSDAFLRILLNANVLVPIPEDAPLEVTPIQRDFRWDAALRDDASVRVFTSLVRLREVLPEVRFVYADFRELIGVWPQVEWAMLLNPGTRIGASLRGEQVRALSEWALRVGLVQLRQEAPLPRPRQPEPVARPQPAADPDDRVSQLAIMQKVVPHGHVAWYLEQGYDRVGGFVHLTSDVAELQTPAQLYEALGLLYADSPFAPGDEGVYVIRWPAYCPDVYRVPFGGATEAEMAAWGESGWVVERAPFVGTGFAPGSAGSIREFKVDSIRLPYGSEMYYLGPDRSERFVAMYDPDRLGWLRPEAGAEGWDGRTEAAQ